MERENEKKNVSIPGFSDIELKLPDDFAESVVVDGGHARPQLRLLLKAESEQAPDKKPD